MKHAVKTLARAALGATLATAVTATAAAETFYACPSGYTFQAAPNAARCFMPATVERGRLAGCPLGFEPRTDRLNNGRDQCVNVNPVTGPVSVNRGCEFGFTYRVVASGADVCERRQSEQITTPSVRVTR